MHAWVNPTPADHVGRDVLVGGCNDAKEGGRAKTLDLRPHDFRPLVKGMDTSPTCLLEEEIRVCTWTFHRKFGVLPFPMERFDIILQRLYECQVFCNAFWHIENTPEAGIHAFCVCETPCARKTVTCVAAIFSGDVCIYTTYHHNMRLWNGTQHAEKTTLEDEGPVCGSHIRGAASAISPTIRATSRAGIACRTTNRAPITF